MTKQEFLKLFELEDIYQKYHEKIPFCFSLNDNLIGSKNSILYFLDKNNKFHLNIECTEFSEFVQKIELNLNFNEDLIEINKNDPLINEFFKFLNFDTNLDASLEFIANFINRILKPKYHLMGHVSTYWIIVFIFYNYRRSANGI